MSYAQAMKAARIKAGLTQQQLADAVFCSAAKVSAYECETYVPGVYYCEDAAYVLGISMDEFLGLEHRPFKGMNGPEYHRRAAGLTQMELADRAEVSVRAVMYIESHSHQPRIDTVVRLAHALGIGVDEYCGCRVR